MDDRWSDLSGALVRRSGDEPLLDDGRKRMDGAGWVPVYDDDRALACAAAIATLAGLEKEEAS